MSMISHKGKGVYMHAHLCVLWLTGVEHMCLILPNFFFAGNGMAMSMMSNKGKGMSMMSKMGKGVYMQMRAQHIRVRVCVCVCVDPSEQRVCVCLCWDPSESGRCVQLATPNIFSAGKGKGVSMMSFKGKGELKDKSLKGLTDSQGSNEIPPTKQGKACTNGRPMK